MSDFVNLKMDHGGIRSVECTRDHDPDYPDPINPMKLGCELRVVCNDGSVFTVRTKMPLAVTEGKVFADSDVNGGGIFIDDPRLLAFIAQKAALLEKVPLGDVDLPSQEESDRIILDLGVPEEPIDDKETIHENYNRLVNKWNKDGKVCKMSDGQWVVERLVAPEYRDEIAVHAEQAELPLG